MDLNSLGFLVEALSGGEKKHPFIIHMGIYDNFSPYYVSLSIEKEGSKAETECVFLTSCDAREIGEKLIFLADLAEKENARRENR